MNVSSLSSLSSLLTEPIVQRLGWTLVHSLWEGVLIAAALAGVLRLLLRGAPATFRYAAACAAMSMLVLCAGFTFTRVAAAQRSGVAPALVHREWRPRIAACGLAPRKC